ncbi:outer membrane efflux protein [Solidesulfovibrio carbinoliphilus subsp. oakridgensis]|uniref:Outer membrane efflux protein n=1 Tax=Solidesulfovibrio carbinoliphilus subsp. oakridgensis TaxID=694327 RepID=G7Q744_9BACT|nr:TolC family protein [Solidesulfovibrio carbinoliphilus]EHJ49001.1 outer membrane efflux protein [Solidesulfovibrio carbinoliphilus subsp. oakridgensis]
MRRPLLFLCLVAALAGCAKVRPEADFAKTAALVAATEDSQPLWVRTPEDEAFVAKEVQAILARGVTMGDAVRLTLINNPGVQARFEAIGVARAEVVQAGLPRNPSLAVLFGFPLFAGGPLGSLAAQAMVSVSDLAEVRDRTAKAQAELEREILVVGHDAMAAAREAKLAWLEMAYARRSLALASDVAGEVKKLAAAGKRYSQFGLADESKLATLEAATARAGLEVAELRARAGVAKARLARVMGLAAGQDFAIAGDVPAEPPALPDAAAAVAFAEANNLGVRAAAYAVKAAQSGVDLENIRWLKDFEVGAGYDLDIESNRTLGPGASVKVPVFDQNQAQKAKAAFRARQAGRLLQEARAEAREAAQRALEEAGLARATAQGLAAGVLPPAKRAADWAGTYARAMQLSELDALEARLGLLRERLRHNQALREEQAALVNLEFALGGRIGSL